jgi:hypothetical protein
MSNEETSIPVTLQTKETTPHMLVANIRYRLMRIYNLYGSYPITEFENAFEQVTGKQTKYIKKETKTLDIFKAFLEKPDYIEMAFVALAQIEEKNGIHKSVDYIAEMNKEDNDKYYVSHLSFDDFIVWTNNKIKELTDICGTSVTKSFELLNDAFKRSCEIYLEHTGSPTVNNKIEQYEMFVDVMASLDIIYKTDWMRDRFIGVVIGCTIGGVA